MMKRTSHFAEHTFGEHNVVANDWRRQEGSNIDLGVEGGARVPESESTIGRVCVWRIGWCSKTRNGGFQLVKLPNPHINAVDWLVTDSTDSIVMNAMLPRRRCV